MTEDNQNNEFKPQPLPGQVFIRPGIDDRPDYEKTLTPEAKAAMRRLSVQQHPRIPEASNERPETQAARIASEGGAPLTAAAHLDVAVPNLESSFLDLRDPMTAPDGTKPTAMQANRLVAGFALGSMLLSAPMAAFNTVLIPQTVSRLSGINRVTDLAMLVIAGAIMTFLLNACIAVGSDHSYCRFGRRTPWIVSGSVLAAICMAILSACDFLPWAVFFWLSTQAAYAMAAIPFAAAFGERVPDKFRDRADSWHGKGLALGQLVGVAVAVALTPHAGGEGWDGTTGFAMLVFAGWLVVAAVVTLLVLPFEGASSYLPRRDVEKGDFFSQYRPPQNAPKFSVAFAARMFAVAATAGIAVYQWYLAPNIVGNTDEAGLFGIAGAGSVVVVMAICTFVGALIAALLLGRIVSLFGDLRIPAVASAVLFMVAALLPLLMDDGFLAVALYALFAGFAYVVFDGASQSLDLAMLPDVRSVGRSLAAYSLANTFGTILGVAACAAVIVATGATVLIFAVATVSMLLAGLLTLRLKSQQ